jgi:hypothetical protein
MGAALAAGDTALAQVLHGAIGALFSVSEAGTAPVVDLAIARARRG